VSVIVVSCRSCGAEFVPSHAELLEGPRIYRPGDRCRDIPIVEASAVRADAPRVPATAVWSERARVWSLTVERCPFCGRKHHHGGNDGPEPDLGARRSHCTTGAGGT